MQNVQKNDCCVAKIIRQMCQNEAKDLIKSYLCSAHLENKNSGLIDKT